MIWVGLRSKSRFPSEYLKGWTLFCGGYSWTEVFGAIWWLKNTHFYRFYWVLQEAMGFPWFLENPFLSNGIEATARPDVGFSHMRYQKALVQNNIKAVGLGFFFDEWIRLMLSCKKNYLDDLLTSSPDVREITLWLWCLKSEVIAVFVMSLMIYLWDEVFTAYLQRLVTCSSLDGKTCHSPNRKADLLFGNQLCFSLSIQSWYSIVDSSMCGEFDPFRSPNSDMVYRSMVNPSRWEVRPL